MANSTIPGLVAVTVPALTDLLGVRQSGDARDKKLTVTQLLSLSPSGGDVSKVGTPVDNQLGVWTGDGTLEGDANLTWDAARLTIAASGLILPAGSAAGPSQVFTGSLATGWYTPVANVISASIAGVQRWSFQADKFNSAGDGGALNFTATDVIPGCIPRGTDLNTGMGGNGADTLTAIAGGVLGQFWNETNAGVLSGYASSPAVTAFATGGQGGATVLINSYNIVTTVATTGDSVRLQGTHDLGSVVYCKNEGANSLDIFPASGDDLGAGVDTAVAIPAGEFKCFITTVAQSTWTELLPVAAGGGGDVFKVGTPANNQLGVWTGDGTIEGDTSWQVVGSAFQGVLGNGPELRNVAGVNIHPRKNDTDTGLASRGDNRLGLVAQGIDGIKLIGASSAVLQQHNTTVGLTAFAGGGAASATQLNSSYSVIDTVATTGDSVKFSTTLEVGVVNYVKNDGANAMDLFPAAGDDLGFGVGVAISVPAGKSVAFIGTVTGSTSTQFIFEEPAPGGDVFKVGTPTDGQIGVWTGDGTIEGTNDLTFNGGVLNVVASTESRFTGDLKLLTGSGQAPMLRDTTVTSINPSVCPAVSDQNTGIGWRSADRLSLVSGGKAGLILAESNSIGVIPNWDTTTGITAFAGGGQGSAVVLDRGYNVATTVATTGDSVKLPTGLGFLKGAVVYIKNDGVNSLDLFPGSGDNLGAGIDTAISVAAGATVAFLGTIEEPTWIQLIFAAGGAGGDVFKVGTPANNQLANWTGDGTLEGDANFLLTGTQLIIPQGSSAGLPELKIGSGQTGFFTASATQLRVTINGTERFTFTNDTIQGFLAGSARMVNRVSSATVPTFVPNTNDDNTGIGGPSGDVLSLIAGGVEVARGITIGGTVQLAVPDGSAGKPTYGFVTDPDTGFFLANTGTIEVSLAGTSHFEFLGTSFGAKIAGGARIVDELPSATNPSFVPNKSDTDTGIGWTSSDVLSLIAGAVEGLTIAESGGVITMTFRGDLQAAGGGGAGPVMRNVSASPSVPTLIPNQADPDTGLTRDSINGVSMVGGGLGCIRGRNIGGARAVGFYTTTPIIQQTGVAVSAAAIHAACVALGLFTA